MVSAGYVNSLSTSTCSSRLWTGPSAEAETETDASDEAVEETQVVAETANGVIEGEAEEATKEEKEG